MPKIAKNMLVIKNVPQAETMNGMLVSVKCTLKTELVTLLRRVHGNNQGFQKATKDYFLQ